MSFDDAMRELPSDPDELKRMVIFWCQRTVTPVSRFVTLWENGKQLKAMLDEDPKVKCKCHPLPVIEEGQ
jgi:hypothetical protein